MVKTFKVEIRNIGNSIGFVIPEEIVNEMRIKKGNKVRVYISK